MLAQIRSVVPVHTADVKQTFPQLKIQSQNRMNEHTLLRIATKGLPFKDFSHAESCQSMGSEKKPRRTHA